MVIFIFVGCSNSNLLRITEKYYNAQNTKNFEVSDLSLTAMDKNASMETEFIEDSQAKYSINVKGTKVTSQKEHKIDLSNDLKTKSSEDKVKGKRLQSDVKSSDNSKTSQVVLVKTLEENKQLSDAQVVRIINDAYLTSINLFHRNIDGEDRLEDSIFCRSKDKSLTHDKIIYTLRNHFSMSFLNKSKLEKECIKIVDGKVYVLALQGLYDGDKEFVILNRKDKDNYINVKVLVKAVDGNITSDIVLVKESGKWKVDSGSIFPQR